MQTLLAILIVLACVAFVGKQVVGTLRTGKGKAGSCCNKGCGGHAEPTAPTAAPAGPQKAREQFIASDMLRKRR